MSQPLFNNDEPLSESKAFESELIEQIEKMDADQRKIWLPIFYDRYTERFFKDNEKIWSVGSIFIPLSLAGLIYLKDMSFINTCLLAIGSIGLILFWVLIAENFRAYQHKSQVVCRSIEVYNGLTITRRKVNPHFSIKKIEIHDVRWLTLWGIIFVWSLAVFFSFLTEIKKIPLSYLLNIIYKYIILLIQ